MASLFKGGLVFDGKDQLLEEHGVLIDRERIVEVAPLPHFEGFTDTIIDTTGSTLMPGLIDCHVHLCYQGVADPFTALSKQSPGQITLIALANARQSLRHGFTSLRDCGGKDYLEFAVRDAIRNGEFQGPTILASGRMICMTGGHGNRMGRVADGCDEVIKAVREQIHAGCDLVKIMATGGVMTPGVNPEDAHYSAEEMRVGIHEAQRFSKRTASHAQGTAGILNAVRGGIDSIEHGIFMSDESIKEMLEAGTYLVPTLAALVNILNNEGNGIADFVIEKSKRIGAVHRKSIIDFYQAGGKIALGTDAGTPFNLHGNNARELEFMVDCGMSTIDALRAGCFNGADLMGLPDHGYIGKGAMADLLIVEGNPVQNISAAADFNNHHAVYKHGALVTG